MPDTNTVSKKQQKQNFKELQDGRAAAAERSWHKGMQTTMEKDILDAGREGKKYPQKHPTFH